MGMPFSLSLLGWNPFFEAQLSKEDLQEFTVARVAIEYKSHYLLYSEKGELQAEPAGRLLFTSSLKSELPKVGDWVLAIAYDTDKAVIHSVLNRKTCLSRKVAGRAGEEQIIAVNLDLLFIVQGLDHDFNINRLERYLSVVQDGIEPVIVLNKTDLCSDAESKAAAVRKRLAHVPVITTSALNDSLTDLQYFFTSNPTAGFVGSSGAGKSTLINRLAGGQLLRTADVRISDSKGRHTTTNRQLVPVASGGILIDTPGMRELQLWATGNLAESAFPQIEELAAHCRFRDCNHIGDEGCAVLQAIERNELSPEQYRNYVKLRREEDYVRSLTDRQFEQKRKKEIKKVHRRINQWKRSK